jgi:hypothetical protein
MTEDDNDLTPPASDPIEQDAKGPVPAPEPEPEEQAAEDQHSDTEKRIARLAHDAREARRQARQLRAENEILKGQRTEAPDAEMDRKVTERAQQIAANDKFNATCQTIFKDGVKEYGEAKFKDAVAAMNEPLGFIPTTLVEAMVDAGNPHKLIQHLGSNHDVLEDLLALPPHRQGTAIAKLAAELAPKAKAVSAAPTPHKTVGGNSKVELDPDKMSIAEYMKHDEQRIMGRYH